MEKDGTLLTPQLGNILPGITRATVFEICERLNIPVEEKQISLEEIHDADSAFFCGTAAEIIGISTLDKIPFKKDWTNSIGIQIQKEYKELVTEKKKKLQAVNG
jgi:branched-chain amino acid aminotransferase